MKWYHYLGVLFIPSLQKNMTGTSDLWVTDPHAAHLFMSIQQLEHRDSAPCCPTPGEDEEVSDGATAADHWLDGSTSREETLPAPVCSRLSPEGFPASDSFTRWALPTMSCQTISFSGYNPLLCFVTPITKFPHVWSNRTPNYGNKTFACGNMSNYHKIIVHCNKALCNETIYVVIEPTTMQ
jgi:hypothetical protein